MAKLLATIFATMHNDMEYLEGKTLKHRIQGKPLGTDEILDLAIQKLCLGSFWRGREMT